mmetsp:Transcript_24286/g.37479  ORF Transcript_24286/g.37479 Transcript_24286/m.37479 type:complete len:93 (+) Transcript_24286:3809-4087(+)
MMLFELSLLMLLFHLLLKLLLLELQLLLLSLELSLLQHLLLLRRGIACSLLLVDLVELLDFSFELRLSCFDLVLLVNQLEVLVVVLEVRLLG